MLLNDPIIYNDDSDVHFYQTNVYKTLNTIYNGFDGKTKNAIVDQYYYAFNTGMSSKIKCPSLKELCLNPNSMDDVFSGCGDYYPLFGSENIEKYKYITNNPLAILYKVNGGSSIYERTYWTRTSYSSTCKYYVTNGSCYYASIGNGSNLAGFIRFGKK